MDKKIYYPHEAVVTKAQVKDYETLYNLTMLT